MTVLIRERARDVYEELDKDDILEGLLNSVSGSIFMNNAGNEHYVTDVDVKNNQNAMRVTISNGDKFEIKIKML